jgi:RNA polymerase sigma factor (TIGR02999 family)
VWYEADVSDVTRILERVQEGDPKAASELLPLVYEELRALAAYRMAQEAPGHTLQPTALVHEAWVRLSGRSQQTWQNRAHFFAAAAEAMRRILVESARRRSRLKRGGALERVNLEEVQLAVDSDPATLLTINEALDRLASEHREKAELVKLRFFTGMSLSEAGRALGLSETTAKRHWAFARAWLYQELAGER